MNLRIFPILAALAGMTSAVPAIAQHVGPSTTTKPYVLPAIDRVSTVSILTAGDYTVDGYRMVGVPDGTGIWPENPMTFNIVADHELQRSKGVARAHGEKGAFVSRFLLERGTLKVLAGRDHLGGPNDVMTWNGGTYVPGTTAFADLCSADLAPREAFRDGETGTFERLFLSGEETAPPKSSDHGRLFAHILTGPDQNKSFELPRLGKMSFENAVASPHRQPKTIVMLNDDAGTATDVTTAALCRTAGLSGCSKPPSELYVYVGTKQSQGNDVERAGLTNGRLYGLRVVANGRVVPGESAELVFGVPGAPAITSARFELVDFGDVSGKTGVELQDAAITEQVTQFMRVEDGAWDPRPAHENDYYFVTTGRLAASSEHWLPSRLWRVRFDDITQPEKGGSIEMLLTNQFYAGADTTPDADPTYQMLDNIAIDSLGRIVLLEDVGSNKRLGRIYLYGIDSGKLELLAVHNATFFSGDAATNQNFLTIDEESSGVVDASGALGSGWFLLTVQSHRNASESDPDLVQGGQLLALYIDPAIGR